jgi:O-antigen/teichoic acid export membrane protein
MMWRKSCLAAALVSYPFAAFSIWNAKDIVSLLFTAAYTEAAIPFAFFAGITFLQVVDYAGLARAMGDSRIIMRSAMLAMSVSVCSTLILALLWGIWGISASLLLSTAFVAVFYVVHYQRTLRRPVGHFFPQWPLLCVGGLAFSAAVVARAAQGLLWSPAGSSFVVQAGKLGLSLAICLGVYVAGLLAVRTLRSSFARSTHVEIAGPGVVGDPASSVKAQGRNGSGSTTPASGE